MRALLILSISSRRVVHWGVTRHPTDAWVAQQLREAIPFGQGPKHLIRDNDDKYGVHFANVAAGAHIDVITTPYRAPRANAVCERVRQRQKNKPASTPTWDNPDKPLAKARQAFEAVFQGGHERLSEPNAGSVNGRDDFDDRREAIVGHR